MPLTSVLKALGIMTCHVRICVSAAQSLGQEPLSHSDADSIQVPLSQCLSFSAAPFLPPTNGARVSLGQLGHSRRQGVFPNLHSCPTPWVCLLFGRIAF